MNEDIMNILKILADKRMEISLIRVRESDTAYKRAMSQVIGLEKEYELLDIEPETRKFVDKLLRSRDDVNMEKNSLAYLAGMEDCIMILRNLEILQL